MDAGDKRINPREGHRAFVDWTHGIHCAGTVAAIFSFFFFFFSPGCLCGSTYQPSLIGAAWVCVFV